MKKQLTLAIILCATLLSCSAQKSEDKTQINGAITDFVMGVNQQKGSLISNAFREGAGFYATNQGIKIISVTPQQLADMHEAKKFGGRDRKYKVENLDITDGIVGYAKVTAYDDVVHYVYHLTFSKIDGKWLIQSALQHSKKV